MTRILLVSRQWHNELVEIIFKTFTVETYNHASSNFGIAYLPPRALPLIRSLYIPILIGNLLDEYWLADCVSVFEQIRNRLPGLRMVELRISTQYTGVEVDRFCEAVTALAKPLEGLEHLDIVSDERRGQRGGRPHRHGIISYEVLLKNCGFGKSKILARRG